MHKLSLNKSIDWVNNSFVNCLTTALVLLFTFNFGWLLTFIRVYTRLSVVKNLNRTIFNLESLLLLGNLGILVAFVAYVMAMRNLKSIMGRRL